MAQWLERQEGGVLIRPGLSGPGGWLRVRVGGRRESPVTLGSLPGSWDGHAVQQEETQWDGHWEVQQ